MIVKFEKPLSDYKYLLAFDLAKKVTGYSLLDIDNDRIIWAGVIDTGHAPDPNMIWDYFYNQIIDIIDNCIKMIGSSKMRSLLITKEQLPTQNGKFSTIATLQSLAQVHAIFDLAVFRSTIDVYDYVGVHSVAAKAYFRHLLDIQSPQKEDIAKYIYQKYSDYDFSALTFDTTDSIAVSLTLLNRKWNSDLQAEMSRVKKELKGAKASSKITRLNEELKKLESLKIV